MNSPSSLNRRRFLQASLLGSAALAGIPCPGEAVADVTKPPQDRMHGLKLGITSYSLRKFNLDQAIAMTKQARLKYISLKDFHLPLKSTTAEREEAHEKIEAAGLILMGGGVIYIKNQPDEIRNVFEYAKDAGMPTIICSPDPEALDAIEQSVRQYNQRIAIHNHGPTDKRYPSPLDVMRLIEKRDARMGICMDVGHTVRIGQDPVAVIEQCSTRLYDFHIKDVTQTDPQGKEVEVGLGVIDIVAVLKALVKINYAGHLALEYEPDPEAPMPGIIASCAYIRGALAAMD